jgi:hopanoid biosynthesis associated protein HpnK
MSGAGQATRLIITADDFGRAEAINDAVELGHRQGVLTAASLMVTGEAAGDAVERARRLPDLGVGLHLALVDAKPALPPERISELTQPDGRFRTDLAWLGARIFFSAQARLQVAAEMRAQFELFRATGLPLAHVDSHHHYHLHPTIFALLVPMAKEYGAKGIRIPFEPPLASWRARRERLIGRLSTAAFHALRASRMRALAIRHGLAVNDAMFGLFDSGQMNARNLLSYVQHLPLGLNEIYCHPGSRAWSEPHPMPESYRPVDEFQALVSPEIKAFIQERGIRLATFAGDRS